MEQLKPVVQTNDVNFGYKLKRLLELNPGKLIRNTSLSTALSCATSQITGAITHLNRRLDTDVHFVAQEIPGAPRGLYYYGPKIQQDELLKMLDTYTGVDDLEIPW